MMMLPNRRIQPHSFPPFHVFHFFFIRFDECTAAKVAVSMVLGGSEHGSVYKYLEGFRSVDKTTDTADPGNSADFSVTVENTGVNVLSCCDGDIEDISVVVSSS